MVEMKSLAVSLFVLVWLISVEPVSAQDQGEQLFSQTCVACHTIGGGRLVGPDLAGVQTRRSEEWVIKFIQSSQDLIASGDADAAALFKEYNSIVMPNHALSVEEVRAIVEYIIRKSPEGGAPADAGVAEDAPTDSGVSMADLGQDLFVGRVRFENGAAACNTCHTVTTGSVMTGGSLAKDLTDAVSRLSKPGVGAMIASPPFPAMRSAFSGKPLSGDEQSAIVDFLASNEADQTGVAAENYRNTLLLWGFVGILLLLGVFFLIGLRGSKQSVNQAIYDRQIRST
jgi:mono/diheme cytochrome c family protein